MSDWVVEYDIDFAGEFRDLALQVRQAIASVALLLEARGPQLGRPHADTLKGSKHPNMKELRLSADGGEWRVAYAFDAKRKAILLVAGDKAGVSEARFYKALIRKADFRFDRHVEFLRTNGSD